MFEKDDFSKFGKISDINNGGVKRVTQGLFL